MKGFLNTTLVLCILTSSLSLSSTAYAADSADELAGTWTLTIDTPRGVQHPTLVIDNNGGDYSGVYNSLRGPIDVETISRDGDSFTFPLTITVPIGDIEVNYNGSFSGDDMTGSVASPRGEVPFTATRDQP